MPRTRLVALASLLLLAMAIPAQAASTARASGRLEVYDRPYGSFKHVLFILADRERVHVLSCTREQRRCEIETLDGEVRGWVDGTYLVGAAAKNAVSPPDILGFDPMDPLDLFSRHH